MYQFMLKAFKQFMTMFQNTTPQNITVSQVLSFLGDGLRIAVSRECRIYVIIPILFNLALMSLAGYWLFTYLNSLIFYLFNMWPDFLIFLAYIISCLMAASIIFVACYFFSTVATILASPFYGLLADKVEMKLNGTKSEDLGFGGVIRDIPRIIRRELKKQMFFIPRALLCLVVMFIPLLNVISPVLWFLLTSWMGCLQYCDYAYDNHKIDFAVMRRDLAQNNLATLSFGALVAIAISVPVLNLIVPPAAVCAGTKYYLSIKNLENQDEEFTS